MDNKLELDFMLRTLDDFIQYSHKIIPCTHVYVNIAQMFHEQLFSRLRSGPLTLKDVHELDNEQHAVLMLLLLSYRRFFSQHPNELKPLFLGTSDEELGATLTLAMSKGWPVNTPTSSDLLCGSFIRYWPPGVGVKQ